ncbi:hypothetical protein OCA05_10835 [Bacillus cereus]|uniref:Phage protein n=1 Tax=Bacillus thuringiensis TaxID=1428 RepID=A0AAW4HN03_BACTU|nr:MULTISPECIES: hypothetical protein [Bacillus cereus group]KLA33096.1 hypothetical protein B4080_1671 [Bacillus cereus]MBN9897453.1 hypothetical protein [Bacillus thuringiensis]MCU5240089.1 hypothetical protein [Bacillus cereus]MCY8957261.1 hypothetical protein [Bacillus cereus]MDY7519522.1 hypothetical protein [Bacillus thuringiensis]
MILQNDKYTHSPVAQDFIWVAEYPDGTHLPEFDFNTKEENSFYKIDRNKLFRFGLIGHGNKIYFERDGIFSIAGHRIQFFYEFDGKTIPLNGDFKYDINDIITFKDAEASGLVAGFQGNGMLSNRITHYSLGYKTNINVEGINFHFKPIVKLPINQPAMINLRMVADQKLDGKVIIVNNGRVAFETKAPLEPNIGGELNWIIQ